MRDSFIFYKSFYDSIKELDPQDQVQIYNAIFEYQFNCKEVELKGVCKSIFTLIIPQLEANNKRYENGKKGGRPKTKTKPNNNLTETKTKPNVNDNDNVNVNDNENVYVNDIITTPTATKTTKHKYGTHNNVLLTDEEHQKLKERFPNDYHEKIDMLSEGLALKGYKYKSHYLAVIKWAKNETPKAAKISVNN